MKKIIVLMVLFLASILWVLHKKNEADAKKLQSQVEKEDAPLVVVKEIPKISNDNKNINIIAAPKKIDKASAVLSGEEIPELDFDNGELIVNKKILELFDYFFKAKDELGKSKVVSYLKQHIHQQPESSHVQLNDILNRFLAFNKDVNKIEYKSDDNASVEVKINNLNEYMQKVNQIRLEHYGEDLARQLYSSQ